MDLPGRQYEIVASPITPDHPHYVEGCQPDLVYARFADINLDEVAALGVEHIAVDLDGTLIPFRGWGFVMDEPTTAKLDEFKSDERFKSVGVATEKGGDPKAILDYLGIFTTAHVVQPWYAGEKAGYLDKLTPNF